MPNWCQNYVELFHDDPKMVRKAIDAFQAKQFLHFAKPMPAPLSNPATSSYGGDDAAKYDAIRAENLRLYGYQGWHDWANANWGTKWDVDGEISVADPNECHFIFDSAWSPPIEAYGALEAQGFRIRAFYAEGGMDFAGWYITGEGESNFSIEQALEEELGEELDERLLVSDWFNQD